MNKKSKGDSKLTVQVTVSTTMAKRFTEGLVDKEAFCLVQPRLMFFLKSWTHVAASEREAFATNTKHKTPEVQLVTVPETTNLT